MPTAKLIRLSLTDPEAAASDPAFGALVSKGWSPSIHWIGHERDDETGEIVRQVLHVIVVPPTPGSEAVDLGGVLQIGGDLERRTAAIDARIARASVIALACMIGQLLATALIGWLVVTHG